jgi:hypothetical protein
MSGKGSAPRPFSVSNEEYANRWDAIFQRDKRKEEDAKIEDEAFKLAEEQNKWRNNNTGTNKNEYYDVLTTEDALDKLAKINDELGLSYEDTYNPLVK